MKHRAIGLLLLATAAGPACLPDIAAASRGPTTHLGECILTADLIVAGRVVAVTPTTYTLEARNVLAGKQIARYEIDRYRHIGEMKPYAIGERLLVFLKRDRDRLSQIGYENEGEVPLRSGNAYPRSPPGAQVIAEQQLLEAVRTFRTRFRSPGKRNATASWAELLGSEDPLVVHLTLAALGRAAEKHPALGAGLRDQLAALLSRPNPHTRSLCARNLAALVGRDRFPDLRQLGKTGTPAQRFAVVVAEAFRDDFDPPYLVKVLKALGAFEATRSELSAAIWILWRSDDVRRKPRAPRLDVLRPAALAALERQEDAYFLDPLLSYLDRRHDEETPDFLHWEEGLPDKDGRTKDVRSIYAVRVEQHRQRWLKRLRR